MSQQRTVQIIHAIHHSPPQSSEVLVPYLYLELRHMAVRMPRHTIREPQTPTTLDDEARLQLTTPNGDPRTLENLGQFIVAASEGLRAILVGRARTKQARRAECTRINIESVSVAMEDSVEAVLAVNDAVEELAKHDTTEADIVKLRYFVGLRTREVGHVLGLTEATVKRRWSFAKSWLKLELQGKGTNAAALSAYC